MSTSFPFWICEEISKAAKLISEPGEGGDRDPAQDATP